MVGQWLGNGWAMVGQWLGNISQSFCYLQNSSMLMFGHSLEILAKTTIINCTAQGWHGREILQAERAFKSDCPQAQKNRNPAACQCKGKRSKRRSSIALLDRSLKSFVVLSASCHSVNRAVAASSAMVKPDLGSSILTKQFASIMQVPDLGR